jgi:hypothetical protein
LILAHRFVLPLKLSAEVLAQYLERLIWLKPEAIKVSFFSLFFFRKFYFWRDKKVKEVAEK